MAVSDEQFQKLEDLTLRCIAGIGAISVILIEAGITTEKVFLDKVKAGGFEVWKQTTENAINQILNARERRN